VLTKITCSEVGTTRKEKTRDFVVDIITWPLAE